MNDATTIDGATAPHLPTPPAAVVAAATAGGIRFLDGEIELGGRDVVDIVDGPDGPVALVDGDELHARTPGGTWEPIARLDDGRGRCLGVHDGVVYVGGAEARLWRLDGDRVVPVESFAHAPTHDEWHTPWGGPPDVYSFAADGTHLYVGVHVGGILRTGDGDRWEATIDLHDDVHQVTVDGAGTVWAATGRRALARSDDRGSSWTYLRDGLHARYALAVAVGAAGPLLSVSSGPFARDGRISRLDGERFVAVDGLPADLGGTVGPGGLVAGGSQAAVALPGGDISVSRDGGASWVPGLPAADGDVHRLALVTRR